MAAENDHQRNEDENSRPDIVPTEDQKFHSELMNRLGVEFPNAFRKEETTNGKPVWYVQRPFSLDPIGLNSTTRWHLTEDGIIGTNDLVNGRIYNPDELIQDLNQAKGERIKHLDDQRGFFEAGEIEQQDYYGRFLIFDPREADERSIRDFGAYLRIAEMTGQIGCVLDCV